MNDLKKAAQDVSNRATESGIVTDADDVMLALREALQAEPEPVAWLFQHDETGLTECVDNQQVEWGFEKNNPRWQKISPLYTTPPSIDALIAEIDAVRKYTHSDTDGYQEDECGDNVDVEDLKAILDKYRRKT